MFLRDVFLIQRLELISVVKRIIFNLVKLVKLNHKTLIIFLLLVYSYTSYLYTSY